jgi:hypothetical protein
VKGAYKLKKAELVQEVIKQVAKGTLAEFVYSIIIVVSYVGYRGRGSTQATQRVPLSSNCKFVICNSDSFFLKYTQ